MRPAKGRTVRFVRALVAGGAATANADGAVAAVAGGRRATLEAVDLRALVSAGVLIRTDDGYRAGPDARTWLRRQLAEPDDHAGQHRELLRKADGSVLNLAESPLSRLAMKGTDGAAPFLAPHQVEAGERVRRLAERARLQPRVTMSYDGAGVAGGNRNGAAEITETAAAARVALAEIPRLLPRDCAGVVFDVCGLLKGLQTVESERGWPRRSAKLVLRIGLDQLARHYGIGAEALGPASRRDRTWIGPGARPDRFE